MNSIDHPLLIGLALNTLSGEKRKIWKPLIPGVRGTCMFPDQHAAALYAGNDGEWRKYFIPGKHRPVSKSAQQPLNKYLPPFSFYIKKMITLIRAGNFEEAAAYLGVFSHLLGDFAQPAHWYESEIFALLPPPPELANCNLHSKIEAVSSSLKKISHSPELLASSGKELEFKLKGRFAQLRMISVAAIVPMVENIYAGKIEKTRECYNSIMEEAARILADFIYSVHCIAAKEFPGHELENCRTCSLLEVAPDSYAVEGLYGMKPFSGCFTPSTEVRPLALLIKDKSGICKIRKVDGICAVPYALPDADRPFWSWMEFRLPRNIYRRFQVSIGLCSEIEPQAKCHFEVSGDGRNIYSSKVMTPSSEALHLDLNINDVFRLKLLVYTDGSTDKLAYPVWMTPMLVK